MEENLLTQRLYEHRFKVENKHPGNGRRSHSLDLKGDSWIWCFTGRRGGGKTTAMTYFAAYYMGVQNTRVLSNYPIEFEYVKTNGDKRVLKAEPLDIYKLLCFDDEYKNCIICMDEAPDIISHMASQSWKNRLLNIFVRQLRKNKNSLFLGAQQFEIIDKSMRWQVDILVDCQDASKAYGNNHIERGSVILLNFLDNSGLWTGHTWEEQIKWNNRHNKSEMVGVQATLHSNMLWGDDTHKPVFDTYYQQDVWESLKKVDMQIGSYKVGGGNNIENNEPIIEALDNAMNHFIAKGQTEVKFTELNNKASEIAGFKINPSKSGAILKESGFKKRQASDGSRYYNIGILTEGGKE